MNAISAPAATIDARIDRLLAGGYRIKAIGEYYRASDTITLRQAIDHIDRLIAALPNAATLVLMCEGCQRPEEDCTCEDDEF